VKLIEKNLRKGIVKVVPESPNDLWHLYNLIFKGDQVYAYTTREVKTDRDYSRPKSGERIGLFLGITVESVSWDRFLNKLRIHGVICQSPETFPVSGHHTLTVALNKPLTIAKTTWSKHLLDRLKRTRTNEETLIILSIDDEGFAIAETREYGVEIKIEERTKLPGKLEADQRSAATKTYFRHVAEKLAQTWSQKRSPIVVLGVGYIKNEFVTFLKNEEQELAKSIVDVKSVNNGGVAAIYEAIRSGILQKTMQQFRLVEESKAVEEVLSKLGRNEHYVAYGMDEVEKAAELGAVEKLLVADRLIRESADETRVKIEELMRRVENARGSMIIVSTEHEAGEKLQGLSGIAAVLRFPIFPKSNQ
jgi:protein pelota